MTPHLPNEPEGEPRRPRARVAGHRPAARRALLRDDDTVLIDTPGDRTLPPQRPVVLDEPAVAAEGGVPEASHDQSHEPSVELARPSRRRGRVLVAAVVIALVLAAALTGGWALKRRADADALAAARAQAVAAASKAIPVVFSYDYRHLDADFAKARGYLTGDFATEYAKTTSSVVSGPAKQYQVVVTAQLATDNKVPLISIVQSSRSRVVLLAFVDQTTQSSRLSAPRIDHNRVRLTLVHTAGGWRVSGVDAL